MATVKEIKDFLENFDDNENIYVAYDDNDELNCAFWTENAIIEKANEYVYDEEDKDSEVKDIDTALQVCFDYDYTYHFMEVDV